MRDVAERFAIRSTGIGRWGALRPSGWGAAGLPLCVGGLLLGAAPVGAAPDPCAESTAGNRVTVTCTGNQSQGVSEADLTPTPAGRAILLRVRDLDVDIAPAANTDGVVIGQPNTPRSGAVRAEIDTGARAIRVEGANRIGVGVVTEMGDARVDLAGRIEVQDESGPPSQFGALGIFVRVARGGGDATATTAAGATVIVNDELSFTSPTTAVASVATEGDARADIAGSLRVTAAQDGNGLILRTDRGDASATVAGSIDVSARDALGISVVARGEGAPPGSGVRPARADVVLEAGSRITIRGTGSTGIQTLAGIDAFTTSGATRVEAAGAIEISGDDTLGINATAQNGDVDVIVSNRIIAPGDNSIGIGVGNSGGRIQVDVAAGGEVVSPTAVFLIGGSSDPAAPNGLTIAAGATVRGALAARRSAVLFDNAGRLDLDGSSLLEAGNYRIENRGRINPGGPGRVASVSVTGLDALRQSDPGVLEVDLDAAAGSSDQLLFAGPTELTLGGRVEVREQGADFRRGTQSYTLLTTGGSLQTAGLNVADTAVVDYELVAAGGALRLDRAVLGFRPPGLGGGSAGETGDYVDRIAEELDPGDPLGPGLLGPLGEIRGMGAYREILARLSPRPYEALLQTTWYAEQAFAEAMWRGCDRGGAMGPGRHCLWGGLVGRQLERRARGPDGDFSSWSLGPRWGVRLGLGHLGPLSVSASSGFGYEATELELAQGGSAEGNRLLGGLALHSRLPLDLAPRGRGLALELDFAADGGFSWYEASRRVAFAGVASARSEPEVGFAGLHGRVGMRWGSGATEPGLYGRLGLEGNAVYVTADDLDETRAGLLAWRFDEVQEVVGTLRPGAEIGGLLHWGSFSLRPHVRIAGTILVGDADPRLRARLASAPRAAGRVTGRGDMDRRLIDVGGGLALSHGEHLALQLSYRGRFAVDDDTRTHEGSLRVQVRF